MVQLFKTQHIRQQDVVRNWHLIDADGAIMGRFATKIAELLMGKHKRNYSPHVDMGDYVVVINAAKVKFTGKKRQQKKYQKHSGYPGGFREVSLENLMQKNPARVIELAVRRMLPDNRLRDKRMRRLKVFPGREHPYSNKFELKSAKT